MLPQQHFFKERIKVQVSNRYVIGNVYGSKNNNQDTRFRWFAYRDENWQTYLESGYAVLSKNPLSAESGMWLD